MQAFRKLDALATNHTEKLRKLTKQVQEYRHNHDDEAVKRAVEEYDDTLEWWVVCVCGGGGGTLAVWELGH